MKKPPHPNLPAPTSYDVGYGKPPEATRFRKGQSGNPRGRPRGARSRPPAMNEERLMDVVIAEAYRTIRVNDGNRQVTNPMAQAIIRSLALNAAKGQHRSQRLFTELLHRTETNLKTRHDEWLKTAIEEIAGLRAYLATESDEDIEAPSNRTSPMRSACAT